MFDEKQQKAVDKQVAAAVKAERTRVIELIDAQVSVATESKDKVRATVLRDLKKAVKVGPAAPPQVQG